MELEIKNELEDLKTKISYVLTDFENDEDEENTDDDWLYEFYELLVKTQNTIDCLQWDD